MFLGKVTKSWDFIRESEQESNTEKGFFRGDLLWGAGVASSVIMKKGRGVLGIKKKGKP